MSQVLWPNDALSEVTYEAHKRAKDAVKKWGPLNSAHEGFAVIHEEFDELKEQIWMNQSKRDLEKMRSEAIDVAVTALRFASELCTEERGRK